MRDRTRFFFAYGTPQNLAIDVSNIGRSTQPGIRKTLTLDVKFMLQEKAQANLFCLKQQQSFELR